VNAATKGYCQAPKASNLLLMRVTPSHLAFICMGIASEVCRALFPVTDGSESHPTDASIIHWDPGSCGIVGDINYILGYIDTRLCGGKDEITS